MPRKSKKNRKKSAGGKRRATTSHIARGGSGNAVSAAPHSVRLASLERKAKKDERLEEKGIFRLGSKNLMLRGLKLPLPLIPLSDQSMNEFKLYFNIFCHDGKPASCETSDGVPTLCGKSAPQCFRNIYSVMLSVLENIRDSARANRWAEKLNVINSEALSYEKIESEATNLLTDIEATIGLSQLDSPDVMGNRIVVVSDIQIDALIARARSRLNLKQYQGAIDDATEGLWLVRACRCIGINHQRVQALMSCSYLFYRARATKMLGDFDGAIIDLRAALALLRLINDASANYFADVSDQLVTQLLGTHARRLMVLKAARPHFTIKQRRKIEKELSFGTCNMTSARHCQVCGVDEAVAGALFRCSGCHGLLVCGKACQAVSWANGHKNECEGNYVCITMCKSGKNALEEDIAKDGFHIIDDDNYGPRIIFPEAQSGTYFCSLTNKDVIIQWIDDKN